MTTIICDVTKKTIPNARREINYVTIRNKTLSMDAKELIEKEVKEKMKARSRYTMKEYWNTYWDIVQEHSR